MTVGELFESLPSRFRKDRCGDWKATFHFSIADAEQEKWTVEILGDRCHVAPGHHGSADCAVSMKEAVYLGIERGETDPQIAVLTGKVKISNLAAMMKFAKCFERARIVE